MAIYDRIQSALEEHLAACPDIATLDGVEWENSKLDAPGPAARWARVKFDPVAAERRGLGEGGHSRIDGLFSIWIHHPLGAGTQEPAVLADRLIEWFKSGTRVESGGEHATCLSAVRRAGGVVDGWWVTPVIVSWYAHTTKV